MKWLNKLKTGLTKSSSKISDGLAHIFIKRKLDQEMLDELEELLISADLGVKISSELVAKLSKTKFDKEVTLEEVKLEFAQAIEKIFSPIPSKLNLENTPTVIMFCGVNGNGKTTSIAKLAKLYQDMGKKVMMAACDTFRAGAAQQLKVWADRIKCHIMIGQPQQDPASLAYEAFAKARDEAYDVVFIDTAGRLHNNKNLMLELEKISRVLKKLDENAPHEVIITLDATTGQNALTQIASFNEIVKITQIIVTKLDGTAKAGVVAAIAQKFQIPIYAIGIGEGMDDLQMFNAKEFVKSLLSI